MLALTIMVGAVVYRLLPFGIETVAAVLALVESLRRGIVPGEMDELVAQSRERSSELWGRFCSRHWSTLLHSPILIFVNDEILRVWPWFWPMWIGPKIAMNRRIWTRTLDRRWRVR